MHRRDWMKTVAAATLALPDTSVAAESKGRFRPAICAYSFRNQLKSGSMTYADLIHMAADLGADGVDLTTYWLADTSDETLYPLKKKPASPTPVTRKQNAPTVLKSVSCTPAAMTFT